MGRWADAKESSEDVYELVDALLGRERRPGEDPPKTLYLCIAAALLALLVLGVYFLFFSGGSGQTTVLDDAPPAPVIPAGSDTCSARDFPGTELSDQDDLPSKVADTRLRIGQRAAKCDLDGLQKLMGADFIWGTPEQVGPEGARADWEAKEANSEPLLQRLAWVTTLDHDVAADGTFVFPAASQWGAPQWANPRPADEAALVTVYGQEAVDRWKASGSFDGYRVGIRKDGTWFYFTGAGL
jgi:hypothetical protein